ncbi:MAG: hypothetical protein HY349_05710, partial [Nitrospirae bacterium]|nr:hypothetical protein [Nitrospirota bacterium]
PLLLFLQIGCGFSADSQKGPSGEGEGLRAEGWAAGVSNLDSGPEMAFSPQIAVEGDPANNGGSDDAQSSAIAVWVKLEDPDTLDSNPQQVYRLYAANFNGATGWGAAAVLDSESANYHSAWSPKVSMDDAGNAIAVWQQSDGTTERIYARRFSGGAWAGAPEVLDSGGGAVSPSIAVEPDGTGTAMAVYTRLQTGNHRAYARRLTGGIGAGAWGAETNIDALSCCQSFATVHSGGTDTQNGDDVGQWTSTALDSNGDVHISYYAVGCTGTCGVADTTNATDLRYSYNLQTICVDGGVGCANATNATVGQYTSLVVDSTGRVFISYYDATNLDLRYATCGSDCLNTANWTSVCVDGRVSPTCIATGATAINTGQYTSLAQDSTGRLHLVYQNASATGVRYTTCLPAAGNSFCAAVNSWTTPVNLPGAASASTYMRLAISASSTAGSPGVLHVAYQGAGTNLRYYSCDITSTGTNCTAAANWGAGFVNIPAVSPNANWISLKAGPSSTGGALARLHLVFYNTGTTRFTYTTCDLTTNTTCATAANWTAIVAVDGAVAANGSTGLGIDGSGRLHVSYYNSTAQDLKYATCSPAGGTTCTVAANWTLSCLEGTTGATCRSSIPVNWNTGQYTSIAVDSFGEVAIAYYETQTNIDSTTGLRLRLATSLGRSAERPVVAMDATGRAIAAFTRAALTGCFAEVENGPTVLPISQDPDANGLNSELSAIGCYPSVPAVNQFDAVASAWQSAFSINPGPPVQVADFNGTSSDICFQAGVGFDDMGGNDWDGNLLGLNSACVNFSQLQIAMQRTTGVAFVVMKLSWNENESGGGCSSPPNDDNHGGGGGDENDNPNNTTGDDDSCAPSWLAWDEFNGNAIAAVRYDGAGWATTDWTNTFLYAHSNHPWATACEESSANGGSTCITNPIDAATMIDKPVISNCPSQGQSTTETGRILLDCQVNNPQVSISGDANGTALVVFERFWKDASGSHHDVYADCFTLGGSTCGVTQNPGLPSGTCTDANLNNGWRSFSCIDASGNPRGNGYVPPPANTDFNNAPFTPTPANSDNPTVTYPYAVLNNIATSRMAFSPQAAIDSTGNGLAVWTERDGNQWRVYGMRFIAGFVGCVVGTNCGFITASRVPIDALGSDPSCASGACMYSNP